MPHDDVWDGYLPAPIADTPAGLQARIEVAELPLEPIVAYNHSPITRFAPGSILPGRPALTTVVVDYDSRRFWSKGNGVEVWSGSVALSDDLPPQMPPDMPQHFGAWQKFWGGYHSIARNRPPAFGDQVPVFDPNTWSTS